MLKFIRGRGQQTSIERQKIQNELFAYSKSVQHGFPHKPSALAYDPKLKLLAIGTHTGVVKIVGRPGVEFYGQHTSDTANAADCSIQLLKWITGTGRILSLTVSNLLILWEPHGTLLDRLQTLPLDGKLKKVSSLCCSLSKNIVWIGTEGGNVYQFDLTSFSIKEQVIYHDIVLENVPETYRLNPGAIESIEQLPNSWNSLLIAYNRGLCILWDVEKKCLLRSYVSLGHGQSIGLYLDPNGLEFTWYHADGSFATWSVVDPDPPENQNFVPYGPDPCKSIDCLVKGFTQQNEVVIFSGGMPRSTYGDRHCVSLLYNNTPNICLDFSSKVIDFVVIYSDPDPAQLEVLIVLLEEEICAFDLTNPSLPPMKKPYLHSIHASAVTCNYMVSDVDTDIYEKIVDAGLKQNKNLSDREWPITGGFLAEKTEDPVKYEILITGHEDGSVKFWDCTYVVMQPIFQLKTGNFFIHDDFEAQNDHSFDEESEPPFRKAGDFDPYSDDPRLAIKKIFFSPQSGQLAIAGTAGQVILASFEYFLQEGPLRIITANLVCDHDGFVWKGHDELKILDEYLEENAGPVYQSNVQIYGMLQVLPPAAVTCVTMQTDWNLIAAGTAHGFVVYNYSTHQIVLSRCTLNPNDISGIGENLPRRKSFKKTLRESFRRLRKGRSSRAAQNSTGVKIETTRPVERQIEARAMDDAMSSMVRCLVFANTFITNVHTTTPTLWAATNSSCVSVFVLSIPKTAEHADSIPASGIITMQLAKEIQLKHRAPIVNIILFDQNGTCLGNQSSDSGTHRVMIASEEQFKVFSLPYLKPVTKYKLTAHEGARVRRVSFASFSGCVSSDMLQSNSSKTTRTMANDHPGEHLNTYTETNLVCLTNLGDCLVLSVPELRRQLNVAAVRREDINGITSFCFTNSGEALYMISSSELQRISLSKTKVIKSKGIIDLEPLPGRESASSNIITLPQENSNEETQHLETNQNKSQNASSGDITIDSIKDHLNTTTLCSKMTEETLGRLSVLSTQVNSEITTSNANNEVKAEHGVSDNLNEYSRKTETNTNTITIKSVITSIAQQD